MEELQQRVAEQRTTQEGLEEELAAARSRACELDSQLAAARDSAGEREAEAGRRAQEYSRRLGAAVAERELWRERASLLAEELEKAVDADFEQKRAAERMAETASYLRCEAGRLARAWRDVQGPQKKICLFLFFNFCR